MDEGSLFFKDSLTRILELMQSTFGTEFKSYYKGIPSQMPPEANFPCLMVQKIAGTYQLGATSTDDFTEEIMIHLLSNRADDAGAPAVIDTTMRHLEELVEARDPTTGQLMPNTAIGALRTKLTLNATITDSSVTVNYGASPQGGGNPNIAEADIKVSLAGYIIIQNRS